MADGVYASMEAMQSLGSDPGADRIFAHAGGPQLIDRHHAVLAFGDPDDRSVGCGAFPVYMTGKAPAGSALPP
jgi:hypothetical protein